MKQLLITIAAVLFVGCGPSVPDISIHDAAKDGNFNAVSLHLAAGTDVDAKDDDGWTPLHLAITNGHKKIVELLIAKGADVNAKDEDGWTPLHHAAINGHKEIAKLLIARGALVQLKDNDGWTPLHFAVGFNREDLAELIASEDADEALLQTYDQRGVVELFITEGADVNAKDKNGRTPLDWAEGEIADLLRTYSGKTAEELKAEEK